MHRFRLVSAILGSILISSVSCSSATDSDSDERIGAAKWPIVNGTPDTTHAAVVAVLARSTECSGTVVQVSGGNGYVLTAAHCCTAQDQPEIVVFSDDYNQMTQANTFNVIKSSITQDPNWNSDTNTHDFCMFQFSGATAATPVIPVVQTADDLAVGTEVEFVGYGLTGDPMNTSSLNSLRRHKTGPIDGVSALLIKYNQAATGSEAVNGGPCEGDSGGPALTTSGPLAVAAVTSAGDAMCAQYGVSGRVSGAYASFIQPYLAGAPIPVVKDCNTCANDTTTNGGACYDSVQACTADASCSALVACYGGCSAEPCYTDCTTKNVAGLAKYTAITSCVCASGCATECAKDASCTQPKCGAGSADAACESCIETQCCSEAWLCSADATCAKCLGGSADTACGSNQPTAQFRQCVSDQCATTCKGGSQTGSSSSTTSSSGGGSSGSQVPSGTSASGGGEGGTASASSGGGVMTGVGGMGSSGATGGNSATGPGSSAIATGGVTTGNVTSGTSSGRGATGVGGDGASDATPTAAGGCSVIHRPTESASGAPLGLLLGLTAILRRRRRARG